MGAHSTLCQGPLLPGWDPPPAHHCSWPPGPSASCLQGHPVSWASWLSHRGLLPPKHHRLAAEPTGVFLRALEAEGQILGPVTVSSLVLRCLLTVTLVAGGPWAVFPEATDPITGFPLPTPAPCGGGVGVRPAPSPCTREEGPGLADVLQSPDRPSFRAVGTPHLPLWPLASVSSLLVLHLLRVVGTPSGDLPCLPAGPS